MGWSLRRPPPHPALRATLSPKGAREEYKRKGLAMAVPVRDPFSFDRAVLNGEMGCDAVGQVFQNAIAEVWILRTDVGDSTAPHPASYLGHPLPKQGEGWGWGLGFSLPESC